MKKTIGFSRSVSMAAASAIALVAGASLTPAEAQTPGASVEAQSRRHFSIPAQPLAQALNEYSRQAGIAVSAPAEVLAGRTSASINGEMTADEALRGMLAGTGLHVEQTASGGYAVQDPNSPMRLGDRSGVPASEADATSEILVIGRQSLNSDIRRSEDDNQPYVVFSAEEIGRSGAANLEQFLSSRLPMNQQQVRGDQSSNDVGGGQINLRGLGTNQTLILIDGRRAPSIATASGDLVQSNVNGIPLAQIDRIEVLPATASGIYGGGATGGVINIILKRNYSGLDIGVGYENTTDFAAAASSLSASGGMTLFDQRTRISFSAAQRDADPLLASDRAELQARGYQLNLANNPASLLALTPFTLLRNVCAVDLMTFNCSSSVNLVLDNGTQLGSPHTVVPAGYLGPIGANDGGAALIEGAGQYALGPPEGGTISRALQSENMAADLRHEVTAWLDGYIHLAHESQASTFSVATVVSTFIPSSSPDNPFQQDIWANFPGPVLVNETSIESDNQRLGLIFDWPNNWNGAIEYDRTETTTSRRSEGVGAFANLAGDLFIQSNALADPATVTRPADYNSLFYILGLTNTEIDSVISDVSFRLGGSVFELPAGRIMFNALLERRDEKIDDIFIENGGLFGGVNTYWMPSLRRSVGSAYLEVHAPIVAPRNTVPLISALDASLSVRRDEYDLNTVGRATLVPSTNGPFPNVTRIESSFASTDYTVFISYSPIRDLTLRTSYGTGFVPPGLVQLVPFPASLASAQGLIDPMRGGAPMTGLLTTVTGGNASLQPEESVSQSLGLIFEPRFIDGLRISFDRTQISKTNEIGGPSVQQLINLESTFPDRITRGPNLPGDQPGWAGPITSVDITAMNAATADVIAYDMQIDYLLETERFGQWRFYLIGTRQTRFERRLLPMSPVVDYVGLANGPLEWRGNFGVDWRLDGLTVGWNAQYFDAYDPCQAGDSPAGCAVSRTQQGGVIPSQTYHDLYLSYAFGPDRGSLSDVEMSVGVQNVFDELPPATYDGGFSTYGDARLQRFAFQVRKHF